MSSSPTFPVLAGEAPATAWEPAGLWGRGFRPFFLGAGLFGAFAVPVWTAIWLGALSTPVWLAPGLWHGHEMAFGLFAAAIAGFLLTAAPVWTGRPALHGAPLKALVAVWAAGRLAFAAANALPVWLVATIDGAFLPLLALALARAVRGSGRHRDHAAVAVVVFLALANAAMHAEALGLVAGVAGRVLRFAVDGVVVLILGIGGPITPAFQESTFRRIGIGRVLRSGPPLLAIGAAAALALADLAGSRALVSGVLATAAGLAGGVRLASWQSPHMRPDPLLAAVHAGTVWVVAGLLLVGLGDLGAPVPATAGLHALTAGAMGATMLAVMTRVGLGPAGRRLALPERIVWCYALVNGGSLARVAAAFVPDEGQAVLLLAGGLAWAAAFGLFTIFYWRIFTQTRVPEGPG